MQRKYFVRGLAAAMVACLSAPLAKAEVAEFDCGDRRGYQPGSPWPTAGGCSTRLGLSGVKGTRVSTVNWQLELGALVSSAVVAADGTQYIGVGTQLVAIAPNGTRRWAAELGSKVEESAAIGWNGVVYAVAKAGSLVALNPKTGARVWTYAAPDELDTAPVIDGHGSIYVIDKAGTVHAVQPNGTARWTRSLGGANHSAITLSRNDLTLYIGSSEKTDDDEKPKKPKHGENYGLRALSALDGSLQWVSPVNEKLTAPALGKDGTLYVGSDKGRLLALYPHDGSIRWSVDEKSCAGGCGKWKKVTQTPAIGPNGLITFGTQEGILLQVSRAGEVQWALDLGDRLWGSPVLDEDGVAFVATHLGALYAIDPNAEVLWSLDGGDHFHASAALGSQGTLYLGTKYGKYYSIGMGPKSSFSSLPVQPTSVPPRDDDGNNLSRGVSYCSALPLPLEIEKRDLPPKNVPFASLESLRVRGLKVSRPGLNAGYANGIFRPQTTGATSEPGCSPQLCDINNVPLSPEMSNLLLNFNPVDQADYDLKIQQIPAALREPCSELPLTAEKDCYVPDFAQQGASCGTGDPACPPDYQCASVCTEDPNIDSEDGCDKRVPRCVKLVPNPLCEEQDNFDLEGCLAVQECAREDDRLSEAEATLQCDGMSCEALKQAQTAEALKAPERNAAAMQPMNIDALIDDLDNADAFCSASESRDVADKGSVGGSPAQSGGGEKKKWGIFHNASFDTSYDLKSGPLGVPLPQVHGGADFKLDGRVWGKEVPIIDLKAVADANLLEAQIGSEASFKLFGYDIATVSAGASLGDGIRDDTGLTKAQQALQKLQGKVTTYSQDARAQLAQLARAHKRIFVDAPNAGAPVITQELCKSILIDEAFLAPVSGKSASYLASQFPNRYGLKEGFAHAVLGRDANNKPMLAALPLELHTVCDAPLTKTTASLLMNELVARYQDGAGGIEDAVRGEYDPKKPGSVFSDFNAALAEQYEDTRDDLENPESQGLYNPKNAAQTRYDSAVYIKGTKQEFSLAAVSATFPIGPIALVVDVQATGFWGIRGGVDYGFEHRLFEAPASANTKLVRLWANANVEPYAGVELDLYVGVGFDFGIGGASVGINGELVLVELGVPLGGTAELYVTQKDLAPAQQTIEWPASVARFASAAEPFLGRKQFAMGAAMGVTAGMNIKALHGDLNLALRVRLLWKTKTWKKKIAELKGIQKTYRWVASKDHEIGSVAVDTTPLRDAIGSVVPQGQFAEYINAIPLPAVDAIDGSVFRSLKDAFDGLGVLNATSIESLGEQLYANDYAYFAPGKLAPHQLVSAAGTRIDPWQPIYKAAGVPQAVIDEQNRLAETNMSGVCWPVVIVE
jgi:outer membrane protein assembly factor BamB